MIKNNENKECHPLSEVAKLLHPQIFTFTAKPEGQKYQK